MCDEYDVDGLRKEIYDYLQTEAYYYPSSIAEMVEVKYYNLPKLLDKAKELGINTDKYLKED